MQVPEGSEGQYFEIEKYFRRSMSVRTRLTNFLLKMNCHYNIVVFRHDAAKDRISDPLANPDPSELEELAREENISVLIGDALVTADPFDTYFTLYNANDKLLGLVRAIALSEGLFVWEGEARNNL